MPLLDKHFDALVSLLATLVIAFVKFVFRPRSRLIFAIRHEFHYLIEEPLRDKDGNVIQAKQQVHSRTIFIKNMGTKAAKSLEVTFNFKPQYMNVWVPRQFEEKLDPNQRYVMQLGELAPKEELHIGLLALNLNLPDVFTVRHQGGLATSQTLNFYPVVPKWRIAAILVAAGLGASTLLYGFIQLARWLLI